MSDRLKPLIGTAADRSLTRSEAEAAFEILFDGAATPAQIGGLLMALRTRGETVTRFEKHDLDFHRALRRGFLDIARAEPERCAVIDAAQGPAAIADAAIAIIDQRLDA